MRWIGNDDLRGWYRASSQLSVLARGIGRQRTDPAFLEEDLGVPFHLVYLARALDADEAGVEIADPEQALDAIPFYSLCRGLLMPLAGMLPERAGRLFGLRIEPPPTGEARQALLARFLAGDFGLSGLQKVACLVGDPFVGRRSRLRRESMLRVLAMETLVTRRQLLDRLTLVGDVAVLYAESRRALRGEPPLTAAEVLETLRLMPGTGRNEQLQLVRSLLGRCGKVEAYFLAKLILGTSGLRYESELLARLIGERYGVDAEQVGHAMALSDVFEVVRLLERDGADGLKAIQLQPLVPVRPALAGGTVEQIRRYPVWTERKYDGIRMMLHKATDRLGSVLCGAYSRNRRDYLELTPGLVNLLRMVAASSLIVDGELHGSVVGAQGFRAATVYEVMSHLQGEARRPVQLRYAAFDLLFVNGRDVTAQPLKVRRQQLQALIGPLAGMPLPIPVAIAEGQMAQGPEDVKRLYQHFRAQGYEGVIAKDLDGPYRLSSRDPSWRKRKPEVTLDLVLLGAVLAVTSKEKAGMFGSYVIGARSAEGGYQDVGDVAGVDRVRDAEIQHTIMKEGLLSGQRIERKTVSGTHPGFELVPHIVVTVKMAGVVREPVSGQLSLRDPKLVVIRADKSAPEADSVKAIEQLYLRQQMG